MKTIRYDTLRSRFRLREVYVAGRTPEFALNVKRYDDSAKESEWKKELMELLGRRLSPREVEYLAGEPLKYVEESEEFFFEFVEELRQYAVEMKKGCRVCSPDYWNKVAALIKADKNTPYPDLEGQPTTEAKLAELAEWRAKDAMEQAYLDQLEGWPLEFAGRQAGWAVLVGARGAVQDLLVEAEDYSESEDLLDEVEDILNAVDWFFAELKELNDGASFNHAVAHYFYQLLDTKDPNRFRFSLNSTGEITANSFAEAQQKAEAQLRIYLSSRVFRLSIEDDYGKVITPVEVKDALIMH